MAHIKTQEEWENEMAEKILSHIRSELYLELRFFQLALAALPVRADAALRTFATDGAVLCFSSEQVLRLFEKNPLFLNRAYLHSVLHCLFSHLWIVPPEVPQRKAGQDTAECCDLQLWHVACDIMVECTIDGMDKSCTRRVLSWSRQKMYEAMEQQKEPQSALTVYRRLKQMSAAETLSLQKEFYTDDHRYWPKREDGSANMQQAALNRKKWDRLSRQINLEQERRGGAPDEGEALCYAQLKAIKARRSYRDFLRQFARRREELHADIQEFDLTFYTYGLRLYGNLPLIEPVETREVKKIREFLIAIDTSYSTNGELIKQFLRETAQILRESESYFADSVIRILQCDDAVRSDTVLAGRRELEQFLERFEVSGGGGTDFRPVFAYVDKLLSAGELKNPGGLIYFTDGLGTYPAKRPAYKTAFLFLKEYDETKVPPWAIRRRIEPEASGGNQTFYIA